MGKFAKGAFYIVVAAACLAVSNLMPTAIIVSAPFIGGWVYPVFYAVSMLLTAVVMTVLVPAGSDVLYLEDIPRIGKRFRIKERLERPFWRKVRAKGAFWLVLTAALAVGSVFSGLTIRFLKLEEKKSWVYALLANGIAITIKVSACLGVFAALKALFFKIIR